MSVTFSELIADIRRKAGDSEATIWTEDEVESYIQQGYEIMSDETGLLFGTALYPDVPACFNYTQPFELPYLLGGWGANGPAQFTCPEERYYVVMLNSNSQGPATHTDTWEHAYESMTEIPAVVTLPEDLHQVERATWNTKRIVPMHSREMEVDDGRYELNKGEVLAYTQDKDGLRQLRKWRVPGAAYVPVSTDDFGIIQTLGDL